MMARGVLRAIGMTAAQLAKAEKAWWAEILIPVSEVYMRIQSSTPHRII
jgi:hypothetical protein